MNKVAMFLVIIGVVFGLLAALPAIEIDKDAVMASSAWSWILAAMYFIPVDTVSTIAGISLALWFFRTTIAVIKTLWQMLPVS